MTRHYPDMGSASDWLNQIPRAARSIRSTTQIWVVTRHQYGILRSFLRRHFAEKPVAASPYVGCFLRLFIKMLSLRGVGVRLRNFRIRVDMLN